MRHLRSAWLALALAVIAPSAIADPSVFITSGGTNSVREWDTASQTLSSPIQVGNHPSALAVAPDGRHVYVANSGVFGGVNNPKASVSVISTVTTGVVATVPNGDTGAAIPGIVVTPDSKRVYVSNDGGDGSVSVIDGIHNSVMPPITMTNGTGFFMPEGLAVTPDGKTVYVLNNDSVLLIDDTIAVPDFFPTPQAPIKIPVGRGARKIAFAPANQNFNIEPAFYVTSAVNNTITAIDPASNTKTATRPLGGTPDDMDIAVTPDGTRAYVTRCSLGEVTVLDISDRTTINVLPTSIQVGGCPSGVAITPDGRSAYVTINAQSTPSPQTLAVIDTASNSVVKTIAVGTSPTVESNGVAIGNVGPGFCFHSCRQKFATHSATCPRVKCICECDGEWIENPKNPCGGRCK